MKITIVHQGTKEFIKDVIERLSCEHNVMVMDAQSCPDYSQLFDSQDLIWAEWCGSEFAKMSHFKGRAKLVCRLHRYEIFTNLMQIYWPNVSKLVFVSEPARKMFDREHPDVEVNKVVIENGINLGKFKLEEMHQGFDIAWVGYLNVRKNPQMIPQILGPLVEVDQRYTVHIAGKWQDRLLYHYMEHLLDRTGLTNNVLFHGWVEDMDGFLSSCQYLLSTSFHESFGYGIVEGMAKGLLPVIHNFPGAEELYPSENLFNHTEEAVDMIKYSEINSGEYRAFVTRYSLENQMDKINQLLTELGGQR
ncbi:MAG: glycosyltransferase [Acidobacteriia bacterium]|nr:glycosyltransferase [Terriglobia bacterium]